MMRNADAEADADADDLGRAKRKRSLVYQQLEVRVQISAVVWERGL